MIRVLTGAVSAAACVLGLAATAAHAADGLVAQYPLTQSAGTVASDVSGNGRDATVMGGATWHGPDGLGFDGVDDGFEIDSPRRMGDQLAGQQVDARISLERAAGQLRELEIVPARQMLPPVAHLGLERGNRTLIVTRKGGKVVTVPLALRTARAIDLAIGERIEGPVFLAADGRRLDRHGAGRIVRATARRAGIAKIVTPHTLRHAFITAALDAGVPLRDVQEAASHADPRTTMRYDRHRGSLDRHATYIVAAYLAGAAR